MNRKYVQRTSRKSRRYGEAFKRQVVSDVNEGLYSACRAMQIYKIGGKMTVYKWLAKYNPSNVFSSRGGKMKDSEKGTSIDLKSRIRYLEQIVSDLTIEKKILETTIEIANETYGLDLKKNIGKVSLSKSIKKTVKRSHSE